MHAIIFSCIIAFWAGFAQAEQQWRHKPVNCASPAEIHESLINVYNLKPIIAGVGHIHSFNIPGGQTSYTPVILYVDTESGRFLFVEYGHGEGACIISVGDGLDFDVNMDKIESMLGLDKKMGM